MLRPRLLALRHSRAFTSSSSLAKPKPSTLPTTTTTITPTSTSTSTSSTVLSTAFSRIQASSLGRALLWYGDKQKKRPYWTQFFSTVVIFLLSDFSAQLLVPWITNDTTHDDQQKTQSGDNAEAAKGILENDRFMFVHNNFNYASKFLSIATKVVLSQVIYAPLFNVYFFSAQSLLSGASWAETLQRLQVTLPVSIVNSAKIWPAVSAFMFLYIDPAFRAIFAGTIALGWQTYLSWLNQLAAKELGRQQHLLLSFINSTLLSMSSSSFDFLEGWTSDDSHSLSASESELDISPDEALLLADLIASVADKPASSATASSQHHHQAAPDIEDHEYLRLALEETFLPDDDSIPDQEHQHQTTARNPIQLDQPKDADKDNADGNNGDRDRDSDVCEEKDSRTPLERFRRPPMKGLSVSDLVSPAWCELQYTYTLLHGPKQTTPAMKRGTVVHQKLENEVHTSVPVTVLSKEDAWALRIWNVIYALRTLRDTGITREMEVWGMLDGEIVTGVIDCLSRDRPTTHADLHPLPAPYSGVRSTKRLHNTRAGWAFEHIGQNIIPLCEEGGIYITEVKTRDAARTGTRLPALDSPSFRPARIQLQLYYHFLTRMVESEDVSVFDIAERYGLKPHAPLSDAFLAQVGSINDDYFENEACSWSQSRPDEGGDGDASSIGDRLDSLTVLLNHNSLSNLWDLLKENLRLTFLRPSTSASTSTSTSTAAGDNQVTLLSPILTVSYMAQDRPTADTEREPENTESKEEVPTDAESGSNTPTPSETHSHNYTQLGTRSFIFDPDSLYPYLIEGLAWWHGRRPAHAIPDSQAWKCQSCDFRGTCSWRRQRFEMHMQKIRERGNSNR
ncbi:uncharacterized protein ARB_05194 [Trichophyton benhamiae CBS 112371]|uniref:Defects in morphology protein 1 n=1 Tax=Arthroderma benhamiae (strain ATCC MYA-4681 / CBS 112371) TaxID=663331 RepID=D4ALJ6_ARTBC|nr:uncharacterized protein ARB_05194 [Trichophyton benhamiae CBS 112371]EFE36255.1 conserved hypothetical protein [Trichophyton benhamiae CBS 112371]